MEDAFSPRMKAIFDFLLSSDASSISTVVIPRTSEQEHKLYLYLREVERQGLNHAPKTILYNLLHTRSETTLTYGLDRTHELKRQIEEMAGHAIEPEALKSAIIESNAARAAIRRIQALREGHAPRISGTEARALIGAWYFMDRGEHARLVREAVEEIQTRTTLHGPRILVKSVPLDNVDLSKAIEDQGAIVVAEDDWWGSRAAGDDIDKSKDPLTAIFEKCYLDSPGPRVFPSEVADAWFKGKAANVDGVIFYLPEEDDVVGWDYPRLRDYLNQRSVPNLMIRTLSPERIKAFIEGFRHA
jgi:benzoyl-CoA reductase/2-hydroxyglutaryl-CoA dehydratase subunit BcrC/BadD/HgdB